MELTVRPEAHLDFGMTAGLANEAFGAIGSAFTPERMEWLYRRAFSHGTLVLGLFAGARKVGQVGLLGQMLQVGGHAEPAVALVDLFIHPQFRSRDAIASLYGRAEAVCRERSIRFLVAVPNGKAVGINQKFLGLDTAATLQFRAGMALPFASRRVRLSSFVETLYRDPATLLLDRFAQDGSGALRWTGSALWERMQDPAARFALHATQDLLLVTTVRTQHHVPAVLHCALLPAAGATVEPADVRAVTAAAARLHGRPFFVYVGLNDRVPLPGWPVPERFRPSLMIVQGRDLQPGGTAPGFGLKRFELLDFDFS